MALHPRRESYGPDMTSTPPTDDAGDATATSTGRPAPRAASLSVDATFYILSNRRRRHLCRYLTESDDGLADFETIVDQLVEWEVAADGEEKEDHGKRVASDLYHAHLPQLSDAGLLDYDERTGTVRYWGHPRIDAWVDIAAAEEFDDFDGFDGFDD